MPKVITVFPESGLFDCFLLKSKQTSLGKYAISSMTLEYPKPFLTVDVVLLSLIDGVLHCGLLRRENPAEVYFGAWSLPGGFIRPQEDEDAMATATRVLRDKVGVASPYLEQLGTFTGSARDPRGWSASIAYYALVPAHIAPENSEHFEWRNIEDVQSMTLPFDHSYIVQQAISRVQSKTSYSTLPLYLMPELFSLTQLRTVYEQVLGGSLEPRGFNRRMLEMGVLEETDQKQSEGFRPARLYRKLTRKLQQSAGVFQPQ
ncbi:MAG TPA: NUDIX domain-containing protein [Alcaligenes faecalis]|nr:NUDIX domain-containing protein [Alcaligenes faecalis]